MTLFGAINIVKYGNFKAAFKVQVLIHHQIGSLLPVNPKKLPEQDPQFLQIYFRNNVEKTLFDDAHSL